MRLNEFLKSWESEYRASCSQIPLFNPRQTRLWSANQKKKFAHLFYHARGRFYAFLWYLGSLASTREQKLVVVSNICEEFGRIGDGNEWGSSHEELYLAFADFVGAENLLESEVLEGSNNTDFLQDFNRGHLEWLIRHSADHRWAAFSAYEWLDNIDYTNLYELAVSMGVEGRALVFFKVHREVEHFKAASPLLEEIWEKDPRTVEEGFTFIGEHQLSMWQELSDAIQQ